MRPLRQRWTALASILALTALAACGSPSDGSTEDGSAAEESSRSSLDNVESFYGEYEDYTSVIAAIQAGDISAEDLEYPFVAQQEHVDAASGWNGKPPFYEMSPPVGGNHLSVWQTCTGSVYEAPIADGNAVHSLEHGAVWLTYDPELVDQAHVDALSLLINGRDYSLMSPYPGQGVPVSLQSWGNRYQTDDPADPAIEEYLDTYILNELFNPEINATCSGGNEATTP